MRLLSSPLWSPKRPMRPCHRSFENGIIRSPPRRVIIHGRSANVLAQPSVSTCWRDDLLQSGRVHLGFLGAAEVDRFGNLTRRSPRPKRIDSAPGSGGACDIASLAIVCGLVDHSKARPTGSGSISDKPWQRRRSGWRKRTGLHAEVQPRHYNESVLRWRGR